jgi:type II secretory ATPase GspE/PulE/Tfp pilus assembly ATPase PilB-like protein
VLCNDCKEEKVLTDAFKKRWHSIIGSHELPSACDAKGCSACNGSGFRGRVGIFELIMITDKLRDAISEGVAENTIRRMLREDGFKTLIADGIEKVRSGITSPEELLRIVQIEDV